MPKTKSRLIVALLILTLSSTLVPLFILKTEAQATGTPTQFIEYSSAWAQATVAVPNIGNITSMTVTPVHQNKSSTTDSYDVLSLVLASNLTANTLVASISTNNDASDIAWRQALRNGSTAYTNVNGTVTVNNLLLVNPLELKIQRNDTRVTVDFSPASTINLTLPATQFPRGNFSATWTVPAFHMEWVGVRNLTLGNTTTSTNPSGWREFNEYAGYSANFTLNVPSWSNYTATGTTGTIREFNVHRGYAPTGIIIPANATKSALIYDGYGQLTVDIPTTGGINRMQVTVGHIIQHTLGFPYESMTVILSATGFNGTIQSFFVTNQNSDYLVYQRTFRNGTNTYTQVGNNITINNIFIINASELVVRRNGSRLTADFTPATQKNITLPVADFPRTNFSATFTMPAFHLDIDWNGIGVSTNNSTSTYSSGWVNNNYLVAYTSNGTIRVPSLNTTASSTASFLPYLVSFSAGPLNTAIIPEFAVQMELFVTIASLVTITGALLLKKRLRTVKPF